MQEMLKLGKIKTKKIKKAKIVKKLKIEKKKYQFMEREVIKELVKEVKEVKDK